MYYASDACTRLAVEGTRRRSFHRIAPAVRLWFCLIALCLLLSGSPPLARAAEPQALDGARVLVIHSYHQGFTWTDNISRGIQSAFTDHANSIEVIFEFMDARRIYTEEYFRQLQELYQLKYAGKKIDVIIASDDQAFNFMMGPGQEIFPDVPLVFASVSGYQPSMRQIYPQMTGLLEVIDIEATLRTALQLQPDTHEVVVITDMTRTGQALKDKANIAFESFQGQVQFRYLQHRTVDELVPQVAALSDGTIVFLFIFSRDQTGRVFSHEHRLKALAEHCDVPIYSVWQFYLGHGIVGGMLTSGEEEGRMAGTMALRILAGEPASTIPLETSPARYMFDHTQLARFGIDEASLPEGSLVINQPFSLYEEYRTLIWGVVSVIVFLLILIAFLIANIVIRRRAEQALLKWAHIFEHAEWGVVVGSADGTTLEMMNSAFARMHGYGVEELTGRPIVDVFAPDSRGALPDHIRVAHEKGHHTFEANHIRRDGTIFPALLNVTAVKDEKGEVLYRVVNVQDIADRVRAEAEILRLQHLLQNIADSMPSALIALDPEGRVLTWNPAAETLTGRGATQVHGQSLWSVCPELARYRELFEQVLREGQVAHRHREQVAGAQGMLYRDVDVFPLEANDVEGAVVRIDDVTRRVQLEEMMLQSAKMASVGGLAAGVAHEVNNPLGAMMQSAQMLQMAFDTQRSRTRQRLQACGVDAEGLECYLRERSVPEYLAGIRETGRRAAKIVSDLLSFSRKRSSEMAPHDLNKLVEQTLDLAAADYDLKKRYDFREIEVVLEMAADLPEVTCDGQQVQQVVFNLVRNAAQAMAQERVRRDGGDGSAYQPRLTLRTGLRQTYEAAHPIEWVRLEIEDNGPGIPEAVREHLFEPFFTTREVGEGTGLGLWLCWSIVVERHGGRIWAESGEVIGTRFVVELPI